MNPTSLGDVIAERKLVMRTTSGTEREVLVLLGKPQAGGAPLEAVPGKALRPCRCCTLRFVKGADF